MQTYNENILASSDVISQEVQQDGIYPTEVRFEESSISVLISNIALTIPRSVPLQDLKVVTPWVAYFVEPAIKVF